MNNKGNILVVEDTKVILLYLTELLQDEGYTVFPVDSGELALKSLEKTNPDLILLDIIMSGINGLEVCRQIKANEKFSVVPVIFLSAVTEIDERLEGLRLGAVDFITKPFHREELIVRVQTHLKLFQLTNTLKQQAAQINTFNQQLLDFNNSLEEKVQLRTNELNEKNIQYGKLNNELQQAKDIAEYNELKYRTILETADDAIVLFDNDLRFVSVNNYFIKKIKKNNDEIINKSLFEIFPKTISTTIQSHVNEVITTKKGVIYDIELPASSCDLFYEIKFSPVFDKTGNVERIVIIARDISAAKRAERAIKESETKLHAAYLYARSLLEASLDPLVTIDADGKITDVNTATENATGFPRNYLIGTDFCDYFTEPEKARIGYQKVFDVGYVIDYPLTIQNSSSKPIDVLYNASIFHVEQGKISGVFAVARDITVRKRVEEKLKANEFILKSLIADKDRFLSILAHDLKSPFNSILGFLSLLIGNIRTYDIEKIEKQLHIINNSAKRTYRLLEEILIWARAQSGKIPYLPQNLDFIAICSEIVENLKFNAETKCITINYFSADNIKIFADKNMSSTVLRNLISNAIKYKQRWKY